MTADETTTQTHDDRWAEKLRTKYGIAEPMARDDDETEDEQ